MNATKKLTLALALALGSSSALALGLGQIKVKSGLNEPLLAVIPILSDDPSELRGLSVELASSEDFSRAGLDYSRLDVPLEFKVVKKPDGSTVIEVTTDEALGQPAVGFLLEVNWANGKLLREYSVLLDPPVIAPAAVTQTTRPVATAAPAATGVNRQPATTRAAPPPEAAPTRAVTPERASVEPAPQPDAPAPVNDVYTVKAGDTLWGIAHAASAGTGLNINRMMVALQQDNPDAFFEDNINALKSGAVLRIPGPDALQQLSAAEANVEVRRQNQAWAETRAAAPTLVSQTGGTDASRLTTASASGNSDRLQLAAPGGSETGGENRPGVDDGTGTAAVAGLKQDIARSKEALASEQQQSSELQARVKALEDLKAKNDSLLNLKNTEIAELQEQLAQAKAAAAAMAEAVENAEEAALAAAAATAATPGMTSIPEPAGSVAALQEDIWGAETPAAATSVSATASAEAVATAASIGLSSTTALAPAATVVTEPIASTIPASTEPAVEPEPASPVELERVDPAPVAGTPWYMRPLVWGIAGVALLALLLGALFSRRRKPHREAFDGELDDEHARLDERADVSDDEYALIDELEQHPDDLSLHLELASLYYALRDQNKFEAAAESMYSHVDDPQQAEWQQVLAMGEELCPDHPLFSDMHADNDLGDDHDPDHSATLADTAESGPEVVDEAESDRAGGPAVASIRRASDSGYNFDFDLTGDRGASDARAAENADQGDNLPMDGEPDEPDLDEPTLSDLASDGAEGDVDDSGFSSDPVDTKLDLARAYHDMGDAEGARAMLDEVLAEGSESQKDVARKLLQDLD